MEVQGYATSADFKEFAYVSMNKTNRRRKTQKIMRFGMLAFFLVLFLLFKDRYGWCAHVVKIACIMGFVFTAVIAVFQVYTLKRYGKMADIDGDLAAFVSITENGVETWTEDGSSRHFYKWRAIKQIIVTGNLYIFMSKYGIAIFCNKSWFGYSQEQELLAVLDAYAANIPKVFRKT